MPGAGPVRVITDRGILTANPETGELELDAIYAGSTAEEVKATVGWDLVVRDPLPTIDPPSPGVLRLIRDVVDPDRHFLRPD